MDYCFGPSITLALVGFLQTFIESITYYRVQPLSNSTIACITINV